MEYDLEVSKNILYIKALKKRLELYERNEDMYSDGETEMLKKENEYLRQASALLTQCCDIKSSRMSYILD